MIGARSSASQSSMGGLTQHSTKASRGISTAARSSAAVGSVAGGTPKLPMKRTEVLFALGIGDVRLWERHLLHYARERLMEASTRDDVDKGTCLKVRLLSEILFSTNSNDKTWQSSWFSAAWGAPVSAPKPKEPPMQFSAFAGRDFCLLMELMQHAMATTMKSHAGPISSPSSSSSSLSQLVCWSEDLLHILSTLLTFHGNVPAVGRFISVLLCSHVLALVRCSSNNCEYDSAMSQTGIPAFCGADKNESGNAKVEAEWATHLLLLRGYLFASLLSRLAQIYYPLWRVFKDETEEMPNFSLYTHCVPLPPSMPDILEGGKKSGSSSYNEDEEPERTRLERLVCSLFNRNSTQNFGAGLLGMPVADDSRGKRAGAKTRNVEEWEKDVPLRREFVQEIAVCIALAEVGRLAILQGSDASAERRERPHDRQRGQQQEKEDKNASDSCSSSYAAFVRGIHYTSSRSTAAMMNSSAKILMATEEEWCKTATATTTTTTTTDADADAGDGVGTQQHQPQFISGHAYSNLRWISGAMCGVLQIVSQASDGALVVPSETMKRWCYPWTYVQQDYYYINLLLTCCCAAKERIPSSLLPFSLQLTHFALSHAVLSGDDEAAFASSELPCNSDGRNTDRRNTNVGDTQSGGRAENACVIATGTLCMTASKFLRFGYQRGFVVSNNEHIRWLSLVLRRQLRQWDQSIRRVVLPMRPNPLCESAASERPGENPLRLLGVEADEQPDEHNNQQQNLWRVLWWHTKSVLECLYVFRDLFHSTLMWSVVKDTSPFRAVMQDLGDALRLICWIDTAEQRVTASPRPPFFTPPASTSTAVQSPLLTPFPVLADPGRRFFLGALLVYVMSATADTLLWFHSWIHKREPSLSDDDDGDSDGADELHFSSSIEGGRLSSGERTASSATKLWLQNFCLLVLLPSCARVMQSIALCTPEESMLPTVLRLHHLVQSNSLLDVLSRATNGSGENRAREQCDDAGGIIKNLHDRMSYLKSPSLVPVTFMETFRISVNLMMLATSMQRAVLHRVTFFRASADDDFREEGRMMRWTLQHRDSLLSIATQLVLRASWASWNLTLPHYTATTAETRCTSGRKTSQLCGASSSTTEIDADGGKETSLPVSHCHKTAAYSTYCQGAPVRAPPPAFDATYVAHVVCSLLRLAVEDSTERDGNSSLAPVPLQNVHALLFGVIGALFRALDAAVYQRSLLCEQLRRLSLRWRSDLPKALPVSSLSWSMPPFLSNIVALWPFAASESDEERLTKANMEAIDAFVDNHELHICDSIMYLACALHQAQCELRERRGDVDAAFACCDAALQLLGQQTLEFLLPDSAVPPTFMLSPLSLDNPGPPPNLPPSSSPFDSATAAARDDALPEKDGSMASTVYTALIASAPLPWGLSVVSGARKEKQRGCSLGSSANPLPAGLLQQKSITLVRVMALIASLTKTKTPHCEEASRKPLFVLHPAAVSHQQWRKLNFALRTMQTAEAELSPASSCVWCQTRQGHGNSDEGCFACSKSLECKLHLLRYIEAALPHLNCTRQDILICRATTAKERLVLFVVLLMLRRATLFFYAYGQENESEEHASEHHHRHPKRYCIRLPQRSRRDAERNVLHAVAAFAYGVRPLRSASELLES